MNFNCKGCNIQYDDTDKCCICTECSRCKNNYLPYVLECPWCKECSKCTKIYSPHLKECPWCKECHTCKKSYLIDFKECPFCYVKKREGNNNFISNTQTNLPSISKRKIELSDDTNYDLYITIKLK